MKKVVLALLMLSILCFSVLPQSISATRIVAFLGDGLKITSDFLPVTIIDVVNSTTATLGNVAITSNIPRSWTITISSSNKGGMKGDKVENKTLYRYLLNFGTVTGIDLSSDFTYVTGSSITNATYPITITYDKATDLVTLPMADTYRDTISISVGAN